VTRTGNDTAPFRRRSLRSAHNLFFGLAAGAALLLADTGMAQQGGATAFSPGALVWAKGGCSECHGGIGEGGTRGEAPPGPNLWRSRLDRDTIKETVSCGRPSTAMPYHVAGAYKERACWGQPLGAAPEEAAQGATLSASEIESLVDFLVANVIGKAPITKAKCGAFYGNNAAYIGCSTFPN